MKIQNPTRLIRLFLCILGLLAAPVYRAAADTIIWTNVTGGNLLWSNPANWTNSVGANVVPTVADDVRFSANSAMIIGATNAPGLVNNIVDADITVGTFQFNAFNPGYATTLINPGATLSIGPGNQTAELFSARHGYTATTNLIGYSTIRGGGSLVVGDTVNPGTAAGSMMRVHSTTTHANSTAQTTLDMAGLNYFSIGVAEIKVGGAGGGQATRGVLILAKTNLIVSAYPTTGNFGFLVGQSTGTGTGNTVDSYGILQLGHQNEIRVNNLKIAGSRTMLGLMEFQTNLLANPSLLLRASSGTGPVAYFSIGDNFDGPNNANYNAAVSTGVVDLSGGTVDAQVDNLYVGRNLNVTTTSRNVGGNGTLTWATGNIDVNTLTVGVQAANNAGSAIGVVNVRSNAILSVNVFSLGGDAGTAAGTGNGTLTIAHGGQVTVTNSIQEANTGANNGVSQINITNGTLRVGGVVRADTLVAQNATLGLTVGATNSLANPVCNFTNAVTFLNAVTINLSGGGLTLTKYPLIKYTGSIGGGGFGVVSLGTLPPNTSGYLTNNTATSSIDLVVTNVPAVRWNGNVAGGDWDINTTANWIDTVTSLATTYKETGFPGDPAIFNDAATGTKTVNLTTALSPATVAVINTTPYAFVGGGSISGPADLFKGGSGTLEIANSGGNFYSGGTVVAAGTLQVNSSISGGGTMLVQAGATLGGTGVISSPITIGSAAILAPGNGIGTLTLNAPVTLAAGSTNIFEVNSDTLAYDQVAGGASITCGGTLVINCSGGGTALTNGAELQLFSAFVTGAFDAFAIVPQYPALDLYWDTSTVALDGRVRILPIPAGNMLIWTNAGGDLLWSNPVNWVRTNPNFPGSYASNSVPTPGDSVLFGNALGFSPVFGAVNNIVDSSQTVSNYTYTALTNNGYHHTRIQSGATLTVDSPQISGNEPNFIVQRDVGLNQQMYATISGTNASLVIGVPSVLNTSFGFEVYATSTNAEPSLSSHRATLDMTALDNFVFWGGYVLIGGSGNLTGNQPSGTLLLAKTNVIVAGRAASQSTAGTIRIGNCLTGSGTGQGENLIELGQENTICGEYLRIGGAQAVNGGAIRFRTGLTSPTLKLRAPDQASRMPLLTMGDNNNTITTNSSRGVLDLNGGIVDLLVDALHVGRSYTTADATRNGSGSGFLTFNAGTLDVTTLNIGCQSANNLASSTGIVQVAGSALLVAGNINLGNDTGTRTGRGYGTLNLNGGTVSVTGNLAENTTGGDGSSAINLTNGFISVGGTITVDDFNAFSGVVSNIGLMTVGTLRGAGTVAGSATVTSLLSPGNSIGNLTNFGDLILSGTSTNVFEVHSDTLAHDFVTGMNSVTYGGTLVISPIGGLGTGITNGASAKLFNAASYGGSFAAIVPPTPGPGLAWDTSLLTVNGTLKITIGVNTTPTNLTFTVVGGNALDILWPADRTGWRLEGQTNAANAGLSTNWFTVPGSTTTNHVIMPLNPANGSVFYRLVYP